MKSAAIALLAFMVFSIFGTKASANPEQDFWVWFKRNDATLFDFEKGQERIFDQLSTQIKRVDPNLTFEFGPKQNGKREFVISADGLRESFPAVISLYDAAPKLDRWIFVKFRPRREPMGIEYAGVKVEVNDVLVSLEPDGDKVAITVYIAKYNVIQANAYGSIGFLMLDQALGEYDMETKVGPVQFQPAHASSVSNKMTLQDLPKAVDDYFKSR